MEINFLLSTQSCSLSSDIVLEALNFLLSSEVRTQDVVIGLAVCKEGRETTWNWLTVNWDHIKKTWVSGHLLNRFVSSVVSPFSSVEKAKEIEAFFANRSLPAMARTLKQSLERVEINARWVESIQKDDQLNELVQELAGGK